MKNLKLIIPVMIGILFINFIMAADCTFGEGGINLTLTDNKITADGYTCTNSGPGGIIDYSYNKWITKIDENINSTVSCNFTDVTFNQSWTNYSQYCKYNIYYNHPLIFLYNMSNVTSQSVITDIDTLDRLESCIGLQNSYRVSWDLCEKLKKEAIGFEGNYTTCSTSLYTCQTERSTATTQVTTLTAEAEKTKNQKWVWGIIGCVLGILGTLYNKGYLGKPKVRNPDESYNRGQSA